MARTYADIVRLRNLEQTSQEVQGLPPGYIAGGKLGLRSDNRVEVYPFAANIYGKYVTLDSTYTLAGSEFEVNQVGGAWYYVYVDNGRSFHVDSLTPSYNSTYFAEYHPLNSWRYLGKIYTNSTDATLVSDVVNAGHISVEDVEASFITADLIAVGAISSTLIATDAIIANLIADGAVGSAAIATGAVVAGSIGASAVTAAAIASDAISTAAIGASQITATLIASDAIITRHILASNVVAAHIAAGQISADHIVAGSISATCIDVTSLTVHTLNVTDTYGRYIEISGAKGLYAQDASGTIVHDIPNATFVAGMGFGGHLLWVEAPTSSAVASSVITYTDATTSLTDTDTPINVDISDILAANGMTNAKGVLLNVYSRGEMQPGRTRLGSNMMLTAFYGLTYNVDPTTGQNMMTSHYWWSQGTSATWIMANRTQAFAPIVWNASTPYLTWGTWGQFYAMGNVTATFMAQWTLHIIGYFV